MKLLLVLSAASFFLVAPCILRSAMMTHASPGQLAWFGTITLGGAAASFVGLLGVLIAPEVLPLTDLPKAVEICFLAARDLFAHPLAHWLAISAALLLLAVLLRLAWAVFSTWLHTRRCRLPRGTFPEEEATLSSSFGEVPGDLRLLRTREIVAFTTGVIRPQTIVSQGVLDALSTAERTALLAHELTHARRRHAAFVFVATVLSHAFGFIPSIRVAVTSLLTALEARADGAAAQRVGDPLVVASALSSLARLSVTPSFAAGIGGGDIRYRLRRLTADSQPRPSNSLVGLLLCFSLVALLSQGAAWVIGGASLSRSLVAIELHDTCHTPHGLHVS